MHAGAAYGGIGQRCVRARAAGGLKSDNPLLGRRCPQIVTEPGQQGFSKKQNPCLAIGALAQQRVVVPRKHDVGVVDGAGKELWQEGRLARERRAHDAPRRGVLQRARARLIRRTRHANLRPAAMAVTGRPQQIHLGLAAMAATGLHEHANVRLTAMAVLGIHACSNGQQPGTAEAARRGMQDVVRAAAAGAAHRVCRAGVAVGQWALQARACMLIHLAAIVRHIRGGLRGAPACFRQEALSHNVTGRLGSGRAPSSNFLGSACRCWAQKQPCMVDARKPGGAAQEAAAGCARAACASRPQCAGCSPTAALAVPVLAPGAAPAAARLRTWARWCWSARARRAPCPAARPRAGCCRRCCAARAWRPLGSPPPRMGSAPAAAAARHARTHQ
jgi:hypothetical protein